MRPRITYIATRVDINKEIKAIEIRNKLIGIKADRLSKKEGISFHNAVKLIKQQ